MPKRNEKEFDDIKAGVEGVLSDVPEPSGEVIPESTVTQEGEIQHLQIILLQKITVHLKVWIWKEFMK